MKILKTLLLGAMMAGAVSLPAFAFDMLKDATEWTKDPTCIMTVYMGMPMSEFENNFSDVAKNGWTRKDNKQETSYYTTFSKVEPIGKSKKFLQMESIEANVQNDNVDHYVVRFEFLNYQPSTGGRDVYHPSLSSKEYNVAFDNAIKIYVALLDNMKAKFGQPDVPDRASNSFYKDTWDGQLRGAAWNVDGVRYKLILSLSKLDKVAREHPIPYNQPGQPVAEVHIVCDPT